MKSSNNHLSLKSTQEKLKASGREFISPPYKGGGSFRILGYVQLDKNGFLRELKMGIRDPGVTFKPVVKLLFSNPH